MTDIVSSPDILESVPITELPEKLIEFAFTTKKITPENEALWTAMGQLRAGVYLDRQYISPEEVDEKGAEFDEYDERADHFVAVKEDGGVIGTVRVINRGEGRGMLPAEIEFGQVLPENTQEISRLIRDPSLSPEEGLLVSLAMMRAALKATYTVSETVYAVLEKKLYRQLNDHIGISLRTIGEPLSIPHYNNTLNYLVEMRPRFITSQIHARDEKMYEKVQRHAALAESILGKPLAPFFERDSRKQGLGRESLRDLTSPNPEQFERNAGFYSPEEQQKLWDSSVAIAGAGGDGGQLAITLAQAGVRHFRLADPENFGVENFNRQAGADYSTIGQNKAEVIAKRLRALGATVDVYPMGVNEENIAEFIEGCDLVIDETEFTMPELGVMISREARAANLPVLMALNVGFGSYVGSFHPEGITFEEYLGLDPKQSLDEIKGQQVDLSKWMPYVPSYANVNVLGKVVRGEMSAPTVTQGVQMAAAEAGTQAVALLLKDINPNWEKHIVWAPNGKSTDAIDGKRTVRFRELSFAKTGLIAALRTRLGQSHPRN